MSGDGTVSVNEADGEVVGMYEFLSGLGVPPGVGTMLEAHPWLWCWVPLPLCLTLILAVRGQWHFEFIPAFKGYQEDLRSGTLPETLAPRLEAALQGHVGKSRSEGWLRLVDGMLARVWGPSIGDIPALERALTVAFVYPLILLLGGGDRGGTLGEAQVLPQAWAFWLWRACRRWPTVWPSGVGLKKQRFWSLPVAST